MTGVQTCALPIYSLNNYLNYGYNILNLLQNEINKLPLHKYLQNHLMFVIGIYSNELNTKINYYQ